ncbi:MAG: two-component regulator propeller domain-containing protein [Phycisphaerae bacterium]
MIDGIYDVPLSHIVKNFTSMKRWLRDELENDLCQTLDSSGVMMVASTKKWCFRLLVLGWLVGLTVAVIHLSQPAEDPPLPSGWTDWRSIGMVRSIALSPGGVFAGGSRGLFQLNEDGKATQIDIPRTRWQPSVSALKYTSHNTLWVGHDQGLSIRTAAGWTSPDVPQTLPRWHVNAMAETRTGRMWIGTTGGAVSMPTIGPWDRDNLHWITTQEGLLHDTVWAIMEDRQGGIWFGNHAAPAGGLSHLQGRRWQHWALQDGLPHSNITSLLAASDDSVWVGCGLFNKGGIAIFRRTTDTWRLVRRLSVADLAGPKVRSLYEDSRGWIWIGSEYHGLAIRGRDRRVVILTTDDGLPGMEIMDIVEAGDGVMWLGTSGGVVRIAPQALEKLFASVDGSRMEPSP